MTEAQFLTRLGHQPSPDRIADALPEFLRSLGFDDAASLLRDKLVGLEDALWREAFEVGRDHERNVQAAKAKEASHADMTPGEAVRAALSEVP